MGIGPKQQTVRKKTFLMKTCNRCGQQKGPEDYAETKSYFYPDGHLPICNQCVNEYLDEHGWDWKYVDKICQYADIPFVPKEWTRVQEMAGNEAFPRYAQIFLSSEFEAFGWGEYFQEFLRLREERKLAEQIPEIGDRRRKELLQKWDGNYDDDELARLEDLLDGMLLTQNINTKLQMDQALKLCKVSLEIDSRIREGAEIDKLLASYEKLIKVANFTPKNSKNASNFESTGELFKWLEAGGWRNKFYDGATRDVVDETIKNIQNWNQRLYVNETGVGEEITRRIEALKIANQNEQSAYDLNEEYDHDKYEADGYNELFFGDEEEVQEFSVDLDGDENE